jgi:hypothetical protein
MVVTITSRSSREEIAAALDKLHKAKSSTRTKKVFDAYKHCGVIKLKENPLVTQKRLRDEWT